MIKSKQPVLFDTEAKYGQNVKDEIISRTMIQSFYIL